MQNFEEIGLNPEILKAITEMGYESPTPIQQEVIPYLLSNQRDLVALAQTGTGKTAAFGLPLVHQLDLETKQTQALILCPTRELCIQVAQELINFSKYLGGLNIGAIYGGESIEKQIRMLKSGCQIVVGTPGRTVDMIDRKQLKIQSIQWLVLDEADEMLTMGFKDDLDKILGTTPDEKQTLLFSATMPKEIESIADNYMDDPKMISAGKRNISAENISHQYFVVKSNQKYAALKRVIEFLPDSMYGVIFCRTRKDAQDLSMKLIQDSFRAEALHGDLAQNQRDKVMFGFRNRHIQFLVATDVAARGIDISDLTHVINYELPENKEVYIHRSGRTGRAGKEGTCFSFVTTRDLDKIQMFEKKIGRSFERKLVPTGEQVCERKLLRLITKVEQAEVNEAQIEKYFPLIEKKLSSLSKEEIIKHFIYVEFKQLLDEYEDAPDLNQKAATTKKNGAATNGNANEKAARVDYSGFKINVGKASNLTPPQLIGFINDCINLRKKVKIGKIDIQEKFSFFEIDQEFSERFMKGYKQSNIQIKGKPIVVEPAKATKSESRYSRKKKPTY